MDQEFKKIDFSHVHGTLYTIFLFCCLLETIIFIYHLMQIQIHISFCLKFSHFYVHDVLQSCTYVPVFIITFMCH